MFIGCLSLPAQDKIEAIPPLPSKKLSCTLIRREGGNWRTYVHAELIDGTRWPARDEQDPKPGVWYSERESAGKAMDDCTDWMKKVKEHYRKKK